MSGRGGSQREEALLREHQILQYLVTQVSFFLFFVFCFLIKELAVNEMVEANAVQKIVRKHIPTEQARTTGVTFENYKPSAFCSSCDSNRNSPSEVSNKVLQGRNLISQKQILRNSELEHLTQVSSRDIVQCPTSR